MAGILTPDDKQQIQQVIYRYAWSLDTGDVEQFVSCFTPNGVLVWDAFEEPDEWSGADALRAFAAHLRDMPSTAGRQHHVANILIEGDTDEARAKAYVVVMACQPGGVGPHSVNVMGWYDDVLKHTSEGWRITRHVIRDWAGPVLARLAGQTGQQPRRQRPAVLNDLPGRSAT
jgi:hypothetical protein